MRILLVWKLLGLVADSYILDICRVAADPCSLIAGSPADKDSLRSHTSTIQKEMKFSSME